MKDRSEGKLDTVVGPQTTVRGDFRVEGSLRLDGRIEGKLDTSEAFQMGAHSQLKGDVTCREALIAGRVEGNITAGGTVELQSGAEVFGDVRCKELVVERGCVLQGNCAMAKTEEAAK